jgi:hypothetical protein
VEANLLEYAAVDGLDIVQHFSMNQVWSSELAYGLPVGLIVVLAAGFRPRPNLRPSAPLDGIRAAGQAARTIGPVVGLVVALGTGLVSVLYDLIEPFPGSSVLVMLRDYLFWVLAFGLAAGLVAGLLVGGASYLRHRLLCALLRHHQLIPPDLIGFLDFADDRILLRRAGGGYLFVHRLLQDYFARQDAQAWQPTAASQTVRTACETGS